MHQSRTTSGHEPQSEQITQRPEHPDEQQTEGADREIRELLGELRVALPSVELLFGFLLVLPFSSRFDILGPTQRNVYVACFLLAAAAVALLIAPSAAHRLAFPGVDKERFVRAASASMLYGLGFVAIAIAMAGYLVVSVLLGEIWAPVIGVALALWFGAWWFVLPRLRFRARR